MVRSTLVTLACSLVCACGSIENITFVLPQERPGVSVREINGDAVKMAIVELADSVNLQILGFANARPNLLRILFKLNEGQTLRFDKLAVAIVDESNGQSIVGRIEKIQANYVENGVGKRRDLHPAETIVGANYEYKTPLGRSGIAATQFQVDIAVEPEFPESFFLEIPQLFLTSREIDIEPIQYTKQSRKIYTAPDPW